MVIESAPVPLFKNKLSIPHTGPQRIGRPRITVLLNQATHYPITLVSSLAGSGKTTALVEWVQQVSVPVAWFSIDEADNDLNRFLVYFVSALQSAAPEAGKAILEAARSQEQLSIENIIALLVNDLIDIPGDLILVLDDYHLIHTGAIQTAVQLFVEHLPPQVHLVIATRADPNLPLARLRSRNRILELRMDQLRFTPAEVAQYLFQVMQLELPKNELALLAGRTEGWIASLQLAALSLKGLPNTLSFIQALSGSNRYVLDYLVEEVLNRQPDEIQSFLLQTCILDRLCASLCDAVTGRQDGQSTLDDLDHNNLFIVLLDEERRWFRYHHLFSDLLRVRLAHMPSGQNKKDLHRRASIWYEENGFAEEAIRHALAAEDFDRAARLVEDHAEDAWLDGRYTSLLGWIQALPRALVYRRPWLCLWNAWSLTQSGTLQEAHEWIDAAEQAIETQEAEIAPGGVSAVSNLQALRYELTILRALFAGLAQRYDQAIELARPLLEHPSSQNTRSSLVARCNIFHGLSSMYYDLGEFDKAEQACLETIRLSREIGFSLRYLHAVNKLAYVYRTTGRLRRSYQMLQESLSLFEEQGTGSSFAVSILYCRWIDLLYEWNRLAEARRLMEDHLKPETIAQVPYLLVDRCNVQARDLLMNHDDAGTQNALNKAAALRQHSFIWPGLVWQTESLQIRLWLKNGEISLVDAWASEQSKGMTSPANGSAALPFSAETGLFARVRVLLAREDYPAALSILGTMASSARAGDRKDSLIKIFVLTAIARQFAGELDQARMALDSALALAEPEGYVRTFLDEGQPIADLLAQLVIGNRSPHLKYASRLLDAFKEDPKSAWEHTPPTIPLQAQRKPAAGAIVEPLSRRELEVLGCMAAGLSNHEAARQLVIETSTVKRHIHNIFAKLGVENRVQALNKAKEIGLL